jgi:hypothetical protein
LYGRIVEIRACSDGPAYVVDWAGNDGAIMVTGNAIWEGYMAFKGACAGKQKAVHASVLNWHQAELLVFK